MWLKQVLTIVRAGTGSVSEKHVYNPCRYCSLSNSMRLGLEITGPALLRRRQISFSEVWRPMHSMTCMRGIFAREELVEAYLYQNGSTPSKHVLRLIAGIKREVEIA